MATKKSKVVSASLKKILNATNFRSEVPMFKPSLEEMECFPSYIETIESENGHRMGIALIRSPEEYKARNGPYIGVDIDGLEIECPVLQLNSGAKGVFLQNSVIQKSMTVAKYREMALLSENDPPYSRGEGGPEDLARKFWSNITFKKPVYGAGVNATLMNSNCNQWTVPHLKTILDLLPDEIQGVTTPWLYFGMRYASFAWHTEDQDLYSINYLHHGAPKTWWAIPETYGNSFEKLAAELFPQEASKCPAFLRHKMAFIHPKILKEHNIPCVMVTQQPGDFVITFPHAYHCGFNNGYNIAESTNFAMPRWIEYGKKAAECHCELSGPETARISMEPFMEKFEGKGAYKKWNDEKIESNRTNKRRSQQNVKLIGTVSEKEAKDDTIVRKRERKNTDPDFGQNWATTKKMKREKPTAVKGISKSTLLNTSTDIRAEDSLASKLTQWKFEMNQMSWTTWQDENPTKIYLQDRTTENATISSNTTMIDHVRTSNEIKDQELGCLISRLCKMICARRRLDNESNVFLTT